MRVGERLKQVFSRKSFEPQEYIFKQSNLCLFSQKIATITVVGDQSSKVLVPPTMESRISLSELNVISLMKQGIGSVCY